MSREFAEDLPYFKTSKQAPDTWLNKAAAEVEKAGGEILSEAFGSSGKEQAFMLRFRVGGQTYRMVWPVAESKYEYKPKELRVFAQAARRQAATMLYHDVKACCVKARALGFEVAFFAHLELRGGKVASEMIGATGSLPKLLKGSK